LKKNKLGERLQKKVLVTGGAGFIGSFLVDKLIEEGHEVKILDSLDTQVHKNGKAPDYLNPKAEFIKGDVTKKQDLEKAIEGVEIVFHKAAVVGVGQSMYEIERYVENNTKGTASLLDFIVNRENSVEKILVASSMSTYGEGLYQCEECGLVEPCLRKEEQMAKGEWEVQCNCGRELKPVPTPESKSQDCNSIYALTKKDQEEMVLMTGKAYGIPAVAFRYFNVLGPRQSLSNPYTGVAAIFLSRIKNNNPPVIYEDGLQTRDFVSVHDIVQANLLGMKSSTADYEVFNVGSGNPIPIKQVAETLIDITGAELKPEITEKFRKGDVRHCYSDISKIRKKLGFEPRVSFREAIEEIIDWSKDVKAEDSFDDASQELKNKGLV
jgi:dTDP-L-rhamnose 4-epimerase